jgi:hypothetical protein
LKKKSKNLVVIIGNGFDLAHGLKTSYNDFANWYLNEVITNELLKLKDGKETSIIRKIFIDKYNKSIPSNITMEPSPKLSEKVKISLIISYIMNNDIKNLKGMLNLKNAPPLKKLIYNPFLCNLYNDKYDNWFDIEQAYYDELLNIFHDKDGYDRVNDSPFIERIDSLNIDLQGIKDALKEYLSTSIKPGEDKNIYYSLSKLLKDRENISYINFNYTSTINCYDRLQNDDDLTKYLKPTIKNIHIHNNLFEDIIFGYGDDTDEEYQKIKMIKNKEFLRCFKTFDYLKSGNYRKVLNELSTFKDGYEVLIIGHSLALTDKTILKTILDNPKCYNIELLKRSDLKSEEEKEESHFELHANLSRIFSSEKDLREKVIPFNLSVNFPLMTGNDTNKFYQREKELYIKKEKPILIDPDIY